MGKAALARMERIATVMMSSTRVRPASGLVTVLDVWGENHIAPLRSFAATVEMTPLGRKVGLGAGACPDLDEGEVRVSRGDGLEGQGGNASLPGDAGDVGRARGRDG